jgi:hypothetical protein
MTANEMAKSTLEDFSQDALPVPPILAVAPGAEQVKEYAADTVVSELGLHICLSCCRIYLAIHDGKLNAVLFSCLSHRGVILM